MCVSLGWALQGAISFSSILFPISGEDSGNEGEADGDEQGSSESRADGETPEKTFTGEESKTPAGEEENDEEEEEEDEDEESKDLQALAEEPKQVLDEMDQPKEVAEEKMERKRSEEESADIAFPDTTISLSHLHSNKRCGQQTCLLYHLRQNPFVELFSISLTQLLTNV